MKTYLLLALLFCAFSTKAQESPTEMQLKTEVLDSLLQTSDLIHVFSGIRSTESSNEILLSTHVWALQNGYIKLGEAYFFDLSHLVWFRMVPHRTAGNVLQLYFN